MENPVQLRRQYSGPLSFPLDANIVSRTGETVTPHHATLNTFDRGAITSYDVDTVLSRDIAIQSNTHADNFSRNKLFGKKGILGRPPLDEHVARAAEIRRRGVVDIGEEPKGETLHFVKRMINKVKERMKKLVRFNHKTTLIVHF